MELAARKPGLAMDLSERASIYMSLDAMRFHAGQSNIVLTLKPAGVVEGRVVREDSAAPVAGARVALVEGFMSGQDSFPSPVVTGADGAFRLADLGPGQYRLQAVVGTNQPPDLVGEPVVVALEAGATNRDVKLTVGPGAVLEVTVHQEAGDRPVKDATVLAASPPDSAEYASTSDRGIARFRLRPGEYQVNASQAGGFGSDFQQVSIERNQTNSVALTLAAPSSSRLAGTVVDAEGKPAPEVMVTAFPFFGVSKQTDAQGRFSLMADSRQFGGMQNTERVLIARDFKRGLAAALEVDEDATNAVLRLEPGLTLSGRITDEHGKPITNAQADFMFHTERMSMGFNRPARADADGRFEIKALPPARQYTVNVSAKGFGRDSRHLDAAETAARRVELEPFQLETANLRISGVVVGPDDKPIPGAMVNSFDPKQPQLNGQTDSQGRFVFEHVCAGPIGLNAHSPRQAGRWGNTTAQGGDTNIVIQLADQARGQVVRSPYGGSKLSGSVVGPDGKPAPRVMVSLFPFFGYAQKRTDEQGRFTLNTQSTMMAGSAPQRVLIARDLERNLAATLDLDEDATNADLKLEAGWSLSGRVTDTNGHAISNAQAQVNLSTDRMSSQLGQPVRVDAVGRFEIKALPHGRRFGVTLSARGFGQDEQNVEAPQTGTQRLQLEEPFTLLAADQRIAGVVLDSDDKPVARRAPLYLRRQATPPEQPSRFPRALLARKGLSRYTPDLRQQPARQQLRLRLRRGRRYQHHNPARFQPGPALPGSQGRLAPGQTAAGPCAPGLGACRGPGWRTALAPAHRCRAAPLPPCLAPPGRAGRRPQTEGSRCDRAPGRRPDRRGLCRLETGGWLSLPDRLFQRAGRKGLLRLGRHSPALADPGRQSAPRDRRRIRAGRTRWEGEGTQVSAERGMTNDE